MKSIFRKAVLLFVSVLFVTGCSNGSSSSSTGGASSEQGKNDYSEVFSIKGIRYKVNDDGTILMKGNFTNNTDEYISLITVDGYAYDKDGKKSGSCWIDGSQIPAHDDSGYAGGDADDQFNNTDINSSSFAGCIFTSYSYFDADNKSSKDMSGSMNLDYPVDQMELWK